MNDDDELVLVLAPVRIGDSAPGVPGEVQIKADCGHQAWISPSGMGTLLARTVRTICMPCVPPGAKQTDDPPPGAREELHRAVGPVLAEKLIAAAQDHMHRGGTFR